MKKTFPRGPSSRVAKAAIGLRSRSATGAAPGPTVAGVKITHPDRVVYAAGGITKLMVAEYYERVAPRLLPYVAGRPLSIVRCPEGTDAPCFFQKHSASTRFPASKWP